MQTARKLDREPSREAIAYFRVSTQRQAASGLGLEAQRESVTTYAKAAGLGVIAEFVETETGTNKKARPQLAKALKEAKARRAVLLIAKIDRLARNVRFVAELMEAGVDFVAVDMPDANRLTVHIIAALAEHEARLISVRTKDALGAAKRRGVRLGNPGNLTRQAQLTGARAMREKAIRETGQAAALARVLRDGGASLRETAQRLNEAGHTTRTGKPWGPVQVARLLGRLE
jgi:DNA invertase Pin-like site-specific DNA recombinase